jgi:hypothetical protein
MERLKYNHFDDRRKNAATARQAMFDKFSTRPPADDPAVQERLAAQKALANERDVRRANRKAMLAAEAERAAKEAARVLSETMALKAQEAAEAAALAQEQAERFARLEADTKARALTLAAEQKAIRNARYAARKARKR